MYRYIIKFCDKKTDTIFDFFLNNHIPMKLKL